MKYKNNTYCGKIENNDVCENDESYKLADSENFLLPQTLFLSSFKPSLDLISLRLKFAKSV